jgi:carbon monoxide dehydrogenase subunit G
MRFESNFFVAAPLERAWHLLLDVPKIAPCLPGARLTEVLGADRYKGEAAVKLGPVQLQFAGEAQLTAVDPSARTARIIAKGADRKGRGNAVATVNFRLSAEGTGTRVNVGTDLTLTGSVAQYGRAATLVREIANELIGQFAANLSTLLIHTSTPVAEATDLSENNAAAPWSGSTNVTRASGIHPAGISAFRLFFVAITRMIERCLARMIGRDS